MVNINADFWCGRSVFVTGHTGFKGGWLTLWLHQLGAKVHGYALDPPTEPALFEVARVATVLASDMRADLADLAQLKSALRKAQPEVIFHLAAQPLVRESYVDPLGTLASNVMGTAHVLEAARSVDSIHAIVLITTDKVYENRECVYPYREVDPLGGHDPYSASKAAAEIVAASYRASFFTGETGHQARVATARAGNVIGGGDWAADRLIPDLMRAFTKGEQAKVRSPHAIRPWQHVLEPLYGYLMLTERLWQDGPEFAVGWNFGPLEADVRPVSDMAQALVAQWGDGAAWGVDGDAHPHETRDLRLDSTKARARLGWQPRWSLDQALTETVAWYKAWAGGQDMRAFTLSQIDTYCQELILCTASSSGPPSLLG
jgi:CDP-glucose 4,6-dehydratase